MKIKGTIPDKVKTQLNLAIAEAVRQYYKEQEEHKNFSRKRILDIATMIKLLLSMHGGSLQKELHEAEISATASAFVQNRKKLSWMDFERC